MSIKSSDGKPSDIERRTTDEKKLKGRIPKEETAKQIMQQLESFNREIAQIESEIYKYRRYNLKQMPNRDQVLKALGEKLTLKFKQKQEYKDKLNHLRTTGQA